MPRPERATTRDEALAREIAEFIAERAFDFSHHECRAWALSDFKVWAAMAGHEPVLSFREEEAASESGSTSPKCNA